MRDDTRLPEACDPDITHDWDDDDTQMVWSHRIGHKDLPEDIRVYGFQDRDGTILTGGRHQPRVSVRDDLSLSPAGAREFGAALIAAADLADRWAGKRS